MTPSGRPRRAGGLKRMLFGVSAAALSVLLAFTALLGLDLCLHKRFEDMAGLNIRGYRGPVVKRKQPGEQRLVVLGGSTALGYGVPPSDSFPVRLQEKLQAHRRQTHRGPVSVVNIAYNSEGAYAFLYNLRYYGSLDYDLALFYTGYNDLGGHNTTVFRNGSPIFRLTGYYPILPLIFREKAMALRYGSVEAGYWAERRGEPVVFRPNLARRSAASVLEASVKMSQTLEQQLARLTKDTPDQSGSSAEMGCGTWNQYCRSLYVAVDEVLHRGKRAVVVTEPYLSEGHQEQQRIMARMLQERFGDHPRLRYVNLGKAVDLRDPALCYDGMHLTAVGNARIAEALVQPILETLQ